MFKIDAIGNDRLDIEMSGKLDAQTMTKALDELTLKSENMANGKMLFTVIDFQIPTLEAVGIEFSRLPSMFGLIRKFDRAAILTDAAWLKRVSEMQGLLIPGLEIKSFNLDQKPEAETWLLTSA